MLGIPIDLWLRVYTVGFVTGAALAGGPFPSPLRALGLFIMTTAALGAMVAIEYVRGYDARRWRKWQIRTRRALRELARRYGHG
jgi:hypothetical protein